MPSVKDQYSNVAVITTTMSAANTLTSNEIITGVSLGQGMGLLIDHVDYWYGTSTLADIDNDGDYIMAALATNSTDYSQADSNVIDQVTMYRIDAGAAANAMIKFFPIERYFTPPIIIATPRLYMNVYSAGMTVAGVVSARIYFRYIKLSAQEYLEIAETFTLVG